MEQVSRRKIYLIEKKFQLSFILKFCGLVAVAGIITIGILYFFGLQSNTVTFVNSRVVVKTTADFILPILAQTVVIVMIIVSIATFSVTLLFSHKVAGPLYHLKKAMKEAEAGDLSGDFRIRQPDQLQELAGTFNTMIHKLKAQIVELKNGLSLLNEKLDSIPENDIAQQKRATLAEIKKITQELNNIIGYFKT